MGRHLKEKRRQYKKNRREKLKKRKEKASNNDVILNEDKVNEYVSTQLDANCGVRQLDGEKGTNIKRDWLYINMVKYFQKKNKFLNFKKEMERPKEDEQASCSEQWLKDFQHLQEQIKSNYSWCET